MGHGHKVRGSADGGARSLGCAVLSLPGVRDIIADRPELRWSAERAASETWLRRAGVWETKHGGSVRLGSARAGVCASKLQRLGLRPRRGSLTTEQCATSPVRWGGDLSDSSDRYSQQCPFLRKGWNGALAVCHLLQRRGRTHLSNQSSGFSRPRDPNQTLH